MFLEVLQNVEVLHFLEVLAETQGYAAGRLRSAVTNVKSDLIPGFNNSSEINDVSDSSALLVKTPL